MAETNLSPKQLSLLMKEIDPVEASARTWTWADGLPLPKHTIQCVQCGASSHDGAIIVRLWNFHHRAKSSWPYRCDVSFKCRICAAVWFHGVAVPRELWERHRDQTFYSRAQGLQVLHGHALSHAASLD